MPKGPSIARIETFVIAARQITDADIPAELRARIAAVSAEVDALRRTDVKIEDHQPIYLDPALYPGAMRQIGCTCGERPKKPNQRSSTALSFYNSHLTRTGIPRPAYSPPVTYGYGQDKGLTWDEVYARDKTDA